MGSCCSISAGRGGGEDKSAFIQHQEGCSRRYKPLSRRVLPPPQPFPPRPAPATLVPFPSLRTCHQLSSLRAAPSSAPSPTPPGCRALLAGQPWGQEEDPRPDKERGKTRERQGAQGQRADDRDEAAPLLTRLPGAAFARRGLETMGLQTSQAESSARAKFLEAKKSTDFGFAT